MERIGIIGAGNSAHALAAYLSHQGHRISLYARDLLKVQHLSNSGMIKSTGKLEGTFPIHCVTGDFARLTSDSRILFIATLTTCYEEIALRLAPHISKDHIIIPFSSKLCGSLEIAATLEKAGAPSIPVIETDALFDCRLTHDKSVWIRGIKAWNLYSCPRRSQTSQHGALVSSFFPGLHAATHILHRGLTDFGAVAHAVISIANISRIDRGEEFGFYYEGLSSRTIVLLEQMEKEFNAVAKSYEADLLPMKEILYNYYGCTTTDLLTAMTTVPNYRHSIAPKTLNHRFLQEDVASTLVPLQQLAALAGIATPTVDAIINLTTLLGQMDMKKIGRSLARLGWAGKTKEEIQEWITG